MSAVAVLCSTCRTPKPEVGSTSARTGCATCSVVRDKATRRYIAEGYDPIMARHLSARDVLLAFFPGVDIDAVHKKR